MNELGTIGLALKRVQARHHRWGDLALAPLGITLVQWDALRHIHENPGASLHQLALLTFQSDQSFGALAGRMTDRGLVERVPGRGRSVRHRLTEHGARVLNFAQAKVDGMLQQSLRPLSEREQQQLHMLLDKINHEADDLLPESAGVAGRSYA